MGDLPALGFLNKEAVTQFSRVADAGVRVISAGKPAEYGAKAAQLLIPADGILVLIQGQIPIPKIIAPLAIEIRRWEELRYREPGNAREAFLRDRVVRERPAGHRIDDRRRESAPQLIRGRDSQQIRKPQDPLIAFEIRKPEGLITPVIELWNPHRPAGHEAVLILPQLGLLLAVLVIEKVVSVKRVIAPEPED